MNTAVLRDFKKLVPGHNNRESAITIKIDCLMKTTQQINKVYVVIALMVSTHLQNFPPKYEDGTTREYNWKIYLHSCCWATVLVSIDLDREFL